MADRIKAREYFTGAQLPKTESLWAEASHWVCDAVGRTPTYTNHANKSPYEMWYGNPPPGSTSTFPQARLLQGQQGKEVSGERTGLCLTGPCASPPSRGRTSADRTPFSAYHA